MTKDNTQQLLSERVLFEAWHLNEFGHAPEMNLYAAHYHRWLK